jgi:hypothetical protein
LLLQHTGEVLTSLFGMSQIHLLRLLFISNHHTGWQCLVPVTHSECVVMAPSRGGCLAPAFPAAKNSGDMPGCSVWAIRRRAVPAGLAFRNGVARECALGRLLPSSYSPPSLSVTPHSHFLPPLFSCTAHVVYSHSFLLFSLIASVSVINCILGPFFACTQTLSLVTARRPPYLHSSRFLDQQPKS